MGQDFLDIQYTSISMDVQLYCSTGLIYTYTNASKRSKCILPFLLNEMRFSSGRNPKWEVSEWLGEGKNKKNFWSIKERIGIIN